MAQYDVYPAKSGEHFLLDIQTDLIDGLATRMIVPLLPLTPSMKTIRKLHPVFVIDGRKYVMATHLMAAVPRAQLGDAKTNLLARHDDIVGGLYMLFQGF